jgi:outer membrane immunogenic protein
MKIRLAFILCAPAFFIAAPGFAADLSAPGLKDAFTSPPQRWSGCHATFQGSYDDMSVSNKYGDRLEDQELQGRRATKDLEPDGLGVGGGLGCDWQSGSWVFGILGDGAYADLSDEVKETAFPNYRFGIESDWFATLRGRIGYAMDRGLIFNVPTLWYVTAGAAWAGLKAENYIPGGVRTSDEQTASGWTVGWGSENAIDDRWSFKTETLYVDYGKDTFFNRNDPVSYGQFKTDTTEWVTRIGITYKLTSW